MLRCSVYCQELGWEFYAHTPQTEGDMWKGYRTQIPTRLHFLAHLSHRLELSSLSSSFSWPSAQLNFHSKILAFYLIFFNVSNIYKSRVTTIINTNAYHPAYSVILLLPNAGSPKISPKQPIDKTKPSLFYPDKGEYSLTRVECFLKVKMEKLGYL